MADPQASTLRNGASLTRRTVWYYKKFVWIPNCLDDFIKIEKNDTNTKGEYRKISGEIKGTDDHFISRAPSGFPLLQELRVHVDHLRVLDRGFGDQSLHLLTEFKQILI